MEAHEPERRLITYRDLLEIVDIGVSGASEGDGLAVSPDGTAVAVQARQALLSENRNSTRWKIVATRGRGAVIDAGDGGESIYAYTAPGLTPGWAVPQIPQWTPDSRFFLYRARHGDDIQLWRSSRDGRSQEQLTTHSSVMSFVVTGDGQKVLYAVCGQSLAARQAANAEAERGYLYDDRFLPVYGIDLPPRSSCLSPAPEEQVWSYDFSSRTERPASDVEIVAYQRLQAERANGARAARPLWLRPTRQQTGAWLGTVAETGGLDQPLTVVAASHGGRPIVCRAVQCTGYFEGLWSNAKGIVYFLRWEDEDRYGPLALYRWRTEAQTVRTIRRSNELLEGCTPAPQDRVVCIDESAVAPGHLVSLDLHTGRTTTLYDPNPTIHDLVLGQVSPLTWRDAAGHAGFGHVVEPVGYQAGHTYPLIVVQYRSRGFLRGGVGNEVPIQILASRGFLVLSFDRPRDKEAYASARSPEDLDRILWNGLRDRRLVWSVLDAGVRKLVELGLADPLRIGITGLSDGANTGVYALIHAPERFAAASLSSTHWNPITYYLLGGAQRESDRWGLGDPHDRDAAASWHELSLAENSGRLRAPLLVQVADSELLPETQTVTELKRAGDPFELYVFPHERHIKSQPVHLYNIYRRNVQWFEFWLQGREEPEPVDAEQYSRWRALRQGRDKLRPAKNNPPS